METSHNKEKQTLGFLSMLETSSRDGYIAGLLITDLKGIPIEFRCTYPVKPTAIQRILYGDSLESYVGINLCASSLLKSVQNDPSILIVSKPYLIEIRKTTRFPVTYLKKAGETPEIGLPELGKKERIDSPMSKFNSVVAFCHPDFSEDAVVIKEILEKSFHFLDPLEPFTRISKAIEMIEKNDRTYK